jgi:hypothetical protein
MRRHFLKSLIFGSAALSLASCGSLIEASKPVNTSLLRIGMSKAEAQQVLRKKPDSTIAAKKSPVSNKVIEVVQYIGFDITNTQTNYWLYFVDDQLERWELANRFGPSI